ALLQSQQQVEVERQELVNIHVVIGMRETVDGDHLIGLLWLNEALRLDEGKDAEWKHRMRIGTTLRQCPKVIQLEKLPDDRPVCMDKIGLTVKFIPPPLKNGLTVIAAAVSADDRLVASATSDGSVTVSEVTGKKLSGGWTAGTAVNRLAFHPN